MNRGPWCHLKDAAGQTVHATAMDPLERPLPPTINLPIGAMSWDSIVASAVASPDRLPPLYREFRREPAHDVGPIAVYLERS